MKEAYTTYNLGNGGITLEFLETLIECCNRYGEVKLVNVGQTSILQLGVELLKYAESKKG